MQVKSRRRVQADVPSQPPLTPPSPDRPQPPLSTPLLRALAAATLVVFLGLLGLSLSRAIQEEADILRYRSATLDLASTIRAMRARALAGRCTMQLRFDPAHRAFQLTAVRGAARPYETLEQTMWWPVGLEISKAPPVLTASPTGRVSPASIVVTAPAYNRLFRLTTNERRGVQFDEEPSF